MTDTVQGANGRVFISYSRKDKPFVQALNDALDRAGVYAWVDWEGIELASDWMETIKDAIQGADAFLFVISPDSLNSKICAQELEFGISLNKKLIPILYREPDKASTLHEKLSSTNWVYLRQEDNFDETLPRLVQSINTDLGWVQQHTHLLQQANEWAQKGRNNSFLLYGTELEESERWSAQASGHENRQIVPIQAEYINASRKYANRRQRFLLAGVSLALVVSIVLSIFALIAREDATRAEAEAVANAERAEQNAQIAQANEETARANEEIARQNEQLANEQRILAEAQRSIAQAQNLQARAGELDTSTLLAVDSYLRVPSSDAESIIRSNLSLLAKPVAHMKQDGSIWNIEWSPSGEYFVTGNSHDPSDEEARNQACVYRASDGSVLFCKEHDDDVNDALFSKDGRYLITASADKTVKLWDAASGELVEELAFDGAVLDLDVSATVLAIGRADNFLTLYYFDKPDLKPVDTEQPEGVGTVRFSPDGTILAAALLNGQVRFWQARGNFFYNGPLHPRSSYAVLAWSPDSNWLLSGGSDSVARLTKRDGSPQHALLHQDWVEGAAFSPDNEWYATASDDNIVRVVDRLTGTERFRMAHADFAQKVIISADGQWIASTGYDEVVRIWDSVSGSQILEIPLDSTGSAISFNPDRTRIVAADEDGNLSIWDISALSARSQTIEFTEFVQQARFTPSGELLIVNADDFNVWKFPADQVHEIHDTTQGEVILTAESLTYDMAISPDSQWVAVVELDTENAQKNRGTLVRVDGSNPMPLLHGGEVTGVEFSSDGRLVATSGVDGFIRLWSTSSGQPAFTLDNSETIYSLAVSPAGSLAAAGLDGRTAVWDLETRQPLTDLAQAGDIVSLAFSADGSLLATGSSEGSILLWSVEGTNLTQIEGMLLMAGSPRDLSFSPDRAWLAGGDATNFAYLWDLKKVQEIARIPHGNAVTSVSFSPDGTQLLTVSRKVVRVWDLSALSLLPSEKLVEIACSYLDGNDSDELQNVCSTVPDDQ
jgi:WD40 repeat protein